jgi:hypothetical protein
MVIRDLTERLIDEGAKLIARLDETGAQVGSAMWMLSPTAEKWKLVMSMPIVAEEGSLKGYQIVQSALAELGDEVRDLASWDTVVLSPDAPLIVHLREAVHTGPGLSRVWFRGAAIGGEMFPDSLVYRAA